MKPVFKHIFWNLSKEEIDLLNIIINIVERNDSFADDDFDYNSTSYIIDTNFHELSSSLGHLELAIPEVMQQLENLTKNIATVYHADEQNIFMNKAAFIYQYNITSTDNDINKRLSIVINTNLIKILRENKRLFEMFYRFAKYELKSKYSKIMYDRFSQKERMVEEFEIDEFVSIIDFGLTYKSMDWARLNSNILKRASKEINDKTNLYFNYEQIKEKVNGRMQTTKIKVSTTLAPEVEDPDMYFDNDFLMERKIAYYIERDIKHKFEQATRFKSQTVNNKDAYLDKMRRKAMESKEEYKAQVLLQEWLNNIKYLNYNHDGLVVLHDYSDDHKHITVNNNFRLYDITKRIELSSSARDTRNKIQAFMEYGDYDIVETGEYLKNCSISYTQG